MSGRPAVLAREIVDAAASPPPRVLARARAHLIDTVGVAAAACGDAAVTSVLGAVGTATARDAALVLGTAAHALDFDNAQVPSLVHPSCVSVPAALAVAASTGADGVRTLTAIALADEVALWFGELAVVVGEGNSRLFERGFHPTGVCAPMGAAAAAGLLYGLSAEELAHAIGIACSFAGGILESNRTGGRIKPVHAGWAASSGITAALTARAGLTAPPTAIEGRFGFRHAFTGVTGDVPPLLTGDGWRMETTHLKPYPTNGFTHPAIDLAVRLRRAGLRASDIATVVVGVPTPTLRTIAEPLAAKRRPATPYEARFSGPFTVAVALRGGGGLGVGLGDLTPDALTDPGLLSLVDRIEFTGDPEADAAFPGAQLCRVTVTLHDGTVRTAVTESTKPTLTEEEQLTKLDSCLAAASRPTAGLRDATLRPVPDLDPAALYAELLTVLT